MNFGDIKMYILFGGGQLLYNIATKLKHNAVSVLVVTSERHATDKISIGGSEKQFIEILKENNIDHILSNDVSTDTNVTHRIIDNTIGISFGAPWIFKQEFINLFKGRLLNCHGARLPQERGAGGFSWRILRGEKIGVSLIHQIDTGVDTGNILLFNEYVYPEQCRYPIDYQNYSLVKYEELFITFFDMINNQKNFECLAQQEYLSSYWPRLATDIHGFIDWNWSLTDIVRFICAFDDPYSGASTFLNNKKVRLKKCFSSNTDGTFHPFQKGLVYRLTADTAFVATEQGTLLINKVLEENEKDILHEVKVGDRFFTPIQHLENANQYRAFYTATGLKV